MDKVAKDIWCEALRSGEFKQGHKQLKRGGRYCCLGVAREVFPALTSAKWGYYLSDESCELLGLSYAQQRELAARNDGDGDLHAHTFAEIADWIERNL